MGIDPLLDVGLDDIDPGVDFAFDVEGVMLPVNDGMGGVGTTPGILFNAVQMTSLLSNNQVKWSDAYSDAVLNVFKAP
jgi:hypothetical protein